MKQTPLKRKSTPRRSQPKRDWMAARAKVEREGDCRINEVWGGECEGELEAAHVVGREHDLCKRHGDDCATEPWKVNPFRIVPLCRFHHRQYDAHQLDLLPALTLDEQLCAVRDTGSLQAALRRTCPTVYRDLFRDGTRRVESI